MEVIKEELLRCLELMISRLPGWIRKKFFNAEKKVGSRLVIDTLNYTIEILRKEKTGYPNYPFDIVEITIPIDNRSEFYDVELKELFLRVFINRALINYIIWNEKDKRLVEELKYLSRGFSINFVIPRDSKTYLTIYVNIPPYIDKSNEIYIDIYGYLTFNSPFGEFTKELRLDNILIKPEDWQKEKKE